MTPLHLPGQGKTQAQHIKNGKMMYLVGTLFIISLPQGGQEQRLLMPARAQAAPRF